MYSKCKFRLHVWEFTSSSNTYEKSAFTCIVFTKGPGPGPVPAPAPAPGPGKRKGKEGAIRVKNGPWPSPPRTRWTNSP